MTIKSALSTGETILAVAGIASAKLDAELIMSKVTGQPREWILINDDNKLSDRKLDTFNSLIRRRANHTPLVHLTGHREFYGLDLKITPSVLTPRVETEQMVEWAIKYAPQGSRLIDLGTGSGALAVAIGHHRPDLTITATDVSAAALRVARSNARTYKVETTLVESNLWQNVSGQFETIVTNLPYLRADAAIDLMEEVKREPAVALFGGDSGLELYNEMLTGINRHLTPGGYLFIECDPWQHDALTTTAKAVELIPVELGYFILGFQLPFTAH